TVPYMELPPFSRSLAWILRPDCASEIGEGPEPSCGKTPLRDPRRRATLEAQRRRRLAMSDKLDHILIAVDDGPSSEAAVQQGLELAAAADASVTFVHVASILGQEFTGNGTRTTRVPVRDRFPLLRTALTRAEEEGVDAEAE